MGFQFLQILITLGSYLNGALCLCFYHFFILCTSEAHCVHFIHAVRKFNKNRDLHKDFLKNVCGSLYKPLPQAKQSFFHIFWKKQKKHLGLGNSFWCIFWRVHFLFRSLWKNWLTFFVKSIKNSTEIGFINNILSCT